ncbi:RHS repeat-associated core domain-containing protein, partial [Escherichia coli]
TRRQIRVNNVLESETHQQQQHGRVVSREHEGWRHSTHRINPDTGKGEDGRFVRVVNAHNITWKYDVNGRLVQKLVDKGGYRPLEWRYKWDARSQLTGLETPEGERWEYKYDPFGRRISKRCTSRDKRGMDFHWNGDQLTAEIPVGADGKPEDENAIRWIYEPGDFTPFARYEKGQLHYAVTDTTGRVQELLTEEGLIVWKGKQQLWGREEGISKEDAPTCRLRFPGQYEDVESGLYYNRFRYYDCDTGQYLCADPMGLRGGDCLYGYVFNPLKIIDPLGLTGDDTVRVRHHTSTEGIDGISKDGSINPARGNPVGVHVEVEPFGDPKTAGAETGAWKNGSYVEFDASKDSLTKTNVGPRNTAVIPTDDPLPLNDKNPIYKKDSFWSRIMSFIKGCDS